MKEIRQSKSKKMFGILDKMKNFDHFAEPVPTFNVKGEETIKTKVGAFVSMMILVAVFYYGLLKSIDLESRGNPSIATYPITTVFDKENPINLN